MSIIYILCYPIIPYNFANYINQTFCYLFVDIYITSDADICVKKLITFPVHFLQSNSSKT